MYEYRQRLVAAAEFCGDTNLGCTRQTWAYHRTSLTRTALHKTKTTFSQIACVGKCKVQQRFDCAQSDFIPGTSFGGHHVLGPDGTHGHPKGWGRVATLYLHTFRRFGCLLTKICGGRASICSAKTLSQRFILGLLPYTKTFVRSVCRVTADTTWDEGLWISAFHLTAESTLTTNNSCNDPCPIPFTTPTFLLDSYPRDADCMICPNHHTCNLNCCMIHVFQQVSEPEALARKL